MKQVHGSDETAQQQQIKVGTRLPSDATFSVFSEGSDSPSDIDISTVFAGKKVVLFATPGAFTSVCSSKHLPDYNAKADELKAAGVDVIACVAVNDAFVMHEWAKSLGIDTKKIMMLADGDGTFAKRLGLSQRLPGMGERALRYSAYVDDMELKHVNVEEPGAEVYKVSGPDHMLEDLEKLI